jgi:hypothetical protein
MAEGMVPWFKVKPRARHDVDVITIPLEHIGTEPVIDVRVTAAGDHILDVSCRGRDFADVAEVGDLGPGDRCVVKVRTDGTPAPLGVTLTVHAAGGTAWDLTLDFPRHEWWRRWVGR